MRASVLVALVACSLAGAAPGSKEKGPPPKPAPLVGEWELVSSTTLGNTRPWDLGGGYVFTADGKHGPKPDGPGAAVTWHRYSADDKANPKTVDIVITDRAGKASTWRWLYRVNGDTLEICWQPEDPSVRPKAFEAGKDSNNAIYTLKKVAPQK